MLFYIDKLSGPKPRNANANRYNVILTMALMVLYLIFGPTNFIFNGYIQGVGSMMGITIPMATYRGDEGWLSWWTVFFWVSS
ncbi:BCCT family transporter [Vibrio lentus]|nr:BCCT family transporter [Vibrio lentus]